MTYSIVYSTRTGNTQLLAETLRSALPQSERVYFGQPSPSALEADRIYVGFWTDKGTCDESTAAFLKLIENREVFLFGSAGFGGDPAYFEKILRKTCKNLNKSVKVAGSFMCQGKMPLSVRQRYEKMLEAPVHMPNLKGMIENFDNALSHPDDTDLNNLIHAVRDAE